MGYQSLPPGSGATDTGPDGLLRLIKKNAKQMDEWQLEDFGGEFYELIGGQTTVTPKSGDKGVDVIVTQEDILRLRGDEITTFVQAKAWPHTTFGSNAVEKIVEKINRHWNSYDRIHIMTTAECTYQAKREVEKYPYVYLWNDERVAQEIINAEAYGILAKYIEY